MKHTAFPITKRSITLPISETQMPRDGGELLGLLFDNTAAEPTEEGKEVNTVCCSSRMYLFNIF